MLKKEYNVIGVMSGTSLDGLDIIFVTFVLEEKWEFKIRISETISYSDHWFNTLREVVNKNRDELKVIDIDYTKYLGFIINDFISKNSIEKIDLICSHGHTALHQPENKLTLQIGNLSILAKLLNKTVVCDFRVQDVELGGQGAPLVPIGDELLFKKYHFCINLGGFANISTSNKNERIAYDICPVNIVLNRYVEKLNLKYDDKGRLASEGFINSELLSKLNDLPFYKKEFPKSLGLEWVNNFVFPLIDSFQLDIKSVLRTFVAHIAIQIAQEINKKEKASVLITGGGVYNLFLIDEIKKITNNKIIIPSIEIIEYKEALIFGLLGVLKQRNEINVLASVTGAKNNHSSGKIFEI